VAILSLLSCFENSCSMIWTTVRYFGKSSLFIMGIHVLLLAPIQSMARAITGKPDLLTGLICLALTMLLIYFLIPFTEKYIPWESGDNDKNRTRNHLKQQNSMDKQVLTIR